MSAGRVGDDPGERRLAAARRAVEDHRADAVGRDRQSERRALAEHLLLTDELVERRGPQAHRQRCHVRQPRRGRVREKVAHAPKYAARVAVDDLTEPVLPGPGASDYERYLRTDELLSLQPEPEKSAHRDELLFTTVHQSSELWLKLAWHEVEEATRLLAEGELDAAIRLLRRALLCAQYVTGQLDMLEQMSPWEYQVIRKKLGHGSGFDSPGFREIRRITPALGQEFSRLLRERGLSLVDLYVQGREHEQLYQLAECLIDWDERLTLWRMRHYKVVSRIIGDEVIGTQGTPVELLGGLIKQKFFPELWEARNRLTELANEE
ncbi:MAG: hypothetical protein E6G02_03130 [Actinobacteria bacterium]|nr:MAG: hypothetical protein E6G02_03130 [Actinomycetota bacterium]